MDTETAHTTLKPGDLVRGVIHHRNELTIGGIKEFYATTCMFLEFRDDISPGCCSILMPNGTVELFNCYWFELSF